MTNTSKGYSQKNIKVKNTIWSVVFAPNYVSIRKETSNPYMSLGKQFPTIHEAIDNYKSLAMKAALMQLL
tara:strand:- start:430 stop:639 length:210 start_codon:yes stop_codon:yes gene_type:complete